MHSTVTLPRIHSTCIVAELVVAQREKNKEWIECNYNVSQRHVLKRIDIIRSMFYYDDCYENKRRHEFDQLLLFINFYIVFVYFERKFEQT